MQKHAEKYAASPDNQRSPSSHSIISTNVNICKICHCETDKEDELITPCYCSGSLLYVHQGCVQKWIRATDAKQCELCQYQYKIESTVKPIRQVRTTSTCFFCLTRHSYYSRYLSFTLLTSLT